MTTEVKNNNMMQEENFTLQEKIESVMGILNTPIDMEIQNIIDEHFWDML